MYAGGSGESFTTHVKFIVEPLSMYRSGAPIISVDGSANKNRKEREYVVNEKTKEKAQSGMGKTISTTPPSTMAEIKFYANPDLEARWNKWKFMVEMLRCFWWPIFWRPAVITLGQCAFWEGRTLFGRICPGHRLAWWQLAGKLVIRSVFWEG